MVRLSGVSIVKVLLCVLCGYARCVGGREAERIFVLHQTGAVLLDIDGTNVVAKQLSKCAPRGMAVDPCSRQALWTCTDGSIQHAGFSETVVDEVMFATTVTIDAERKNGVVRMNEANSYYFSEYHDIGYMVKQENIVLCSTAVLNTVCAAMDRCEWDGIACVDKTTDPLSVLSSRSAVDYGGGLTYDGTDLWITGTSSNNDGQIARGPPYGGTPPYHTGLETYWSTVSTDADVLVAGYPYTTASLDSVYVPAISTKTGTRIVKLSKADMSLKGEEVASGLPTMKRYSKTAEDATGSPQPAFAVVENGAAVIFIDASKIMYQKLDGSDPVALYESAETWNVHGPMVVFEACPTTPAPDTEVPETTAPLAVPQTAEPTVAPADTTVAPTFSSPAPKDTTAPLTTTAPGSTAAPTAVPITAVPGTTASPTSPTTSPTTRSPTEPGMVWLAPSPAPAAEDDSSANTVVIVVAAICGVLVVVFCCLIYFCTRPRKVDAFSLANQINRTRLAEEVMSEPMTPLREIKVGELPMEAMPLNLSDFEEHRQQEQGDVTDVMRSLRPQPSPPVTARTPPEESADVSWVQTKRVMKEVVEGERYVDASYKTWHEEQTALPAYPPRRRLGPTSSMQSIVSSSSPLTPLRRPSHSAPLGEHPSSRGSTSGDSPRPHKSGDAPLPPRRPRRSSFQTAK